MALSEYFLQDLKARCDISEIASSYINLKRRGKNLVGLCPFHSEKTPSFNIYPENGSFYCFGCGAGGDVITFIRRIENLDYIEAVKFLAQKAGMQMPDDTAGDGTSKLKTRILEINRETARFFHSVLLSDEGKDGLSYLRRRALSDRTIRHFGLGFAPPARFALTDHLKKNGFRDEELIAANVAVQARSGRAIDRFFGRVMFPIIDLRGNVIAFGGRILTDEKPKYLNTSDTLVFHKSNSLFALNFAKNAGADQLILAEGYMDVIALHQAGFENAVATLGTALTPDQARLMARYTKEVAVCYDSDEAGQKAASRAIPILREAGLLVKVLAVPGNKDPDEFIRSYKEEGPARFKKLLSESGNDVEYRLQKLRGQYDLTRPDGKVAYLNAAVEVVASLDNPIEQDVYAGKLSEETGVDKASIRAQAGKLRKKNFGEREKKEFRAMEQDVAAFRDDVNPDKHKYLRGANAEEALLAYLMSNPDDAGRIAEKIRGENFCTGFGARVYEVIMGKMKDGAELNLTTLSGDFSMPELSALARILAKHNEITDTRQDADEYIRVILEEKKKINEDTLGAATELDIQKYLEQLRESKK